MDHSRNNSNFFEEEKNDENQIYTQENGIKFPLLSLLQILDLNKE